MQYDQCSWPDSVWGIDLGAAMRRIANVLVRTFECSRRRCGALAVAHRSDKSFTENVVHGRTEGEGSLLDFRFGAVYVRAETCS